jgi:hypothetical protein
LEVGRWEREVEKKNRRKGDEEKKSNESILEIW